MQPSAVYLPLVPKPLLFPSTDVTFMCLIFLSRRGWSPNRRTNRKVRKRVSLHQGIFLCSACTDGLWALNVKLVVNENYHRKKKEFFSTCVLFMYVLWPKYPDSNTNTDNIIGATFTKWQLNYFKVVQSLLLNKSNNFYVLKLMNNLPLQSFPQSGF